MRKKMLVAVLGLMILSIFVGCEQDPPSTESNISSEVAIDETDTQQEAPDQVINTELDQKENQSVSTVGSEQYDEVATDVEITEEVSIKPIYFEGNRDEVLTQKIMLGRGNAYVKASDDYFEMVMGVTDINNFDYLFQTDKKYYTKEDFADCSETILKLAKNEIYARHGRMFADAELYEYFLTRMWYEPQYTPDEFDESQFNDYEKENLQLLVDLGA